MLYVLFLGLKAYPVAWTSSPPPEKDVAENSRISTQGLLYRKYTVQNQRINRFGVVVCTVREGGNTAWCTVAVAVYCFRRQHLS